MISFVSLNNGLINRKTFLFKHTENTNNAVKPHMLNMRNTLRKINV
jgi:hypothetical protein